MTHSLTELLGDSPWTHRSSVDWRETEKQAARNLDQRTLDLDDYAKYVETQWVGKPIAAPLSQSSNLERYAGALIELEGVTLLSAAAAVV